MRLGGGHEDAVAGQTVSDDLVARPGGELVVAVDAGEVVEDACVTSA